MVLYEKSCEWREQNCEPTLKEVVEVFKTIFQNYEGYCNLANIYNVNEFDLGYAEGFIDAMCYTSAYVFWDHKCWKSEAYEEFKELHNTILKNTNLVYERIQEEKKKH